MKRGQTARSSRPKGRYFDEFSGFSFASYIPDLEQRSWQIGNTNDYRPQEKCPSEHNPVLSSQRAMKMTT